jgi:hypothetical protein
MTKFFLTFLLSLSALQADCSNYALLGAPDSKEISKDFKNSLVWTKEKNNWSLSKPIENFSLSSSVCKTTGYVLLNNDKANFRAPLYKESSYKIKRGWNLLNTPQEGVDVAKTFQNVEFVYVYDKRSSLWAAYSPRADLMKKIKESKLLTLKYIEPRRAFYVLATKSMKTTIHSKVPNAQCQALMKNKNYEILYDSGIDNAFTFNTDTTLGLRSRNFSHTRRGVYNDSRVMIIVPKLKKYAADKTYRKYGPAIPKMMLLFNAAYAEKEFYAYDFLEESCRKGFFPSPKAPPAPVMLKVK